jgi:hypothetical protein
VGLIIFVSVGVTRDEDGESLSAFEVCDVIGVLSLVGGSDIIDGLGDHLTGDGVGHALVAEDA